MTRENRTRPSATQAQRRMASSARAGRSQQSRRQQQYATPSLYGRNTHTQHASIMQQLPAWALPAAIIVAAIIVITLVARSCSAPQSDPDTTTQEVIEEGTYSTADALAAGGIAADGSTDISTSFAAYNWDELKSIANEIAAAPSSSAALDIARHYRLVTDEGMLTGDVKPITLSDGTPAGVQIAGFYHDDTAKAPASGTDESARATDSAAQKASYSSAEKAGITFILRDCFPEKRCANVSGNSNGGWEQSDIRAWLQGENGAASILPADITAKVIYVNKETNNEGATEHGADEATCVTATTDDYWLFSKAELVGLITSSEVDTSVALAREGTQYQFFSDSGVIDDTPASILEKSLQGEPTLWWTRTTKLDAGWGYCTVLKTGSSETYCYWADNEYGVVPGFCF